MLNVILMEPLFKVLFFNSLDKKDLTALMNKRLKNIKYLLIN